MASFILAAHMAQLRQTTWSTVMRHARIAFPGSAVLALLRMMVRAAIRDCRRHGVGPKRTLTASPLDKPNTVLILQDICPVRLRHLGRERGDPACVFPYLDRPQDLIAALGIP